MRRGCLAAALAVCCLVSPATGQEAGEVRQLVVEQIEVSGAPRTRPEVIARHLSLGVGDPLQPEDLLTNRQQLADTGLFKDVDVYARPGSAKGLVVVVVVVEEHRWPQYRFEGGHGELDGWYLAPVGFVYDNPTGRGHRLDWKWYLGSHVDGTRTHYQHPYLDDGTATLDVYLFSEDRSYPHFVAGTEFHETVSTEGYSARFTRRSWLRQLYCQVRSQEYRPKADPVLAALLRDDLEPTQVTAAGLGLQEDTRDHPGHPTRGFWGRAVFEGAGGDVSFTKLTLDGRWYRQLGGRKVAALRAFGGLVTDGAPFYERFYLGGPFSLRGFEWAELTPAGWGTRTLLVQSELRFPFGVQDADGPRHTGVCYYDTGGIWLAGEVPVPTDLHHSFGVGYRRRLRVLGMLRLDFSLPMRGVDAGDFHLNLSLGHAF